MKFSLVYIPMLNFNDLKQCLRARDIAETGKKYGSCVNKKYGNKSCSSSWFWPPVINQKINSSQPKREKTRVLIHSFVEHQLLQIINWKTHHLRQVVGFCCGEKTQLSQEYYHLFHSSLVYIEDLYAKLDVLDQSIITPQTSN